MKKGTLVRYQIVKYHDVGGGHLFPRPVNQTLMKLPAARRELRKLQENDFANVALYGLSRWIIPADSLVAFHTRHYTVEN